MSVKIYMPAGVNVEDVSSSQSFELLTCAYGQDGSKWVYAKAGEAITQYMAVAIEEDGDAFALTKALADGGDKIGIAQVGFATGQFGWFLTEGGGTTYKVRLKNGCLPNVGLYTTATAGYLDDTSASQTQVWGIVAKDTATSSGAAEEVFIAGQLHAQATP